MGFLLALARSALTRGGVTGIARRSAVATALGFGGAAVFEGVGDEPGAPRRRRRRRVLTANDRADISFITATLGAPAGKSFAMIVAARA